MTISMALISPIVTALCAFLGSWFALSTRLAKVETKVDRLSEDVRKHNGVIERTYKLETEVENIKHQID